MNFVQQLEESLRDLAAESRKKHPGVKEASERATLKLRQLKNSYVVAVRQASKQTDNAVHPTTSLFQSSELLHPFLLAANYPNASARLLEISFRAMRLILEADALVPSDGLHLVRVWMIQAHVVVAYYQKQYPVKGSALGNHGNSSPTIDTSQSFTVTGSTEAETTTNNATTTPSTPSSGSSSGWFGWASSTASAVTVEGTGAAIKNAVSSSTGQTGQSFQSSKEMEKLALDLLSCLLQLLEGLRKYPHHLTTEVWTNALALACLWLSPLPPRHTVRQAANSTVSQLLSLLYTPVTSSPESNDIQQAHVTFLRDTWNDLLVMAQSPVDTTTPFAGAFPLCRNTSKTASRTPIPAPPSPNFALDLMTRLWRDHLQEPDDTVWMAVFAENQSGDNNKPRNELIVKSIACTETWLTEISLPSCTIERSHRIIQWTGLVLQTQSQNYPEQCRNLIPPLTKAISLATEACRTRHEFEDGYVYNSKGESSPKLDTKSNQAVVQSSQSYFPTVLLWKAGLILEVLYRVLEKDFDTYIGMLSDQATMGALTESLSDFATIGASCRDHMEQVIEFCDSPKAQQHSLQPTIARRTEHGISAGTVDEVRTDAKKGGTSNVSVPSNLLGEALWMAFHGIVRMTQSLSVSGNLVDLVEETFAACLAVLQHFLKRFPGSPNLVHMSLQGYSTLADACLSVPGTAMQRKALLSSLCKLSLPSWGKHDPTSQLQNHHIPCLITLLRIVHKHFEDIPSEWDLVLWTFEELSVMSIASVKLDEKAYHGALAITAVFSRFGPFSACFTVDSLLKFVDALSQIVQVLMEDRDLLGDSVMVPHERSNQETNARASPPKDQSIGRQIVSIGVRAIYGGQSSSVGSSSVTDSSEAIERTKGSFYEEYRQDFAKRITTTKSAVRVGAIGRLPFCLSLLIDVAMANSFRYAICGESVSGKLSALAAASPPVRPFLMDIIAMLTMSHIAEGGPSPAPFVGPAKLAIEDPTQSQLLAVESLATDGMPRAKENSKSVAQSDLLAPLCETIRTTDKAEVAEAALGTINAVLETAGHNLTGEVWTVVINAVASLSGDASYGIERSSPAWATCCLNAFNCLKLIASDFRDQLRGDAAARSALLTCCFAFGSSRHDVNTSLTAIGLLWTIADQDSDSNSSSVQEALTKLVELSSDTRAEVRNAAINTLFSCIVGRGATFSDQQWESFFVDTVFVVYRTVEQAKKSDQPPAPPSDTTPSSRYKLSRHHSQDSEGKQWITSQVIVLRGLLRVLRNFFPLLLRTSTASNRNTGENSVPWFQDCWVQILDFAYDASACGGNRDTLDIRTVGVELLSISCQLSSKAGISAAAAPARVGTHMEVVNGALRSVRESKQQSAKEMMGTLRSDAEEQLRRNIFLESFESLESYIELLEDAVQKGEGITDTQLQVLHKFCVGLCQVFECCKHEELLNDQTKQSILFLESLLGEASLLEREENLERRFVQMAITSIQMSTVNPTARFLNQAQRAALDLLKNMALEGSVEAFRALLKLSGDANFARMESDADESESGYTTGTETKLLASEASTHLCYAIAEGKTCCECRIYVFYMVACLLRSPTSSESKPDRDPRRLPSYRRILPVLVGGFQAIQEVSPDVRGESGEKISGLADVVYKEFCTVLKELLSPMPTRERLERIRRAPDLVEIVTAMTERTTAPHIDHICSVLSFGATKSLKTSLIHEDFESLHDENDLLSKSREHRVELLSLFRCCFKGLCLLKPTDPELKHVAREALHETQKAINEEEAGSSIRVQIGLAICEEICLFGQELQSLVTNIFPILCKLIVSENHSIRIAVEKVFETAQIGSLLEDQSARTNRILYEREREKSALLRRIEELENQNVKLRQDLAVLEASTGL